MMKNIDYLSLDGRSLYMIKLIYEHRSVTEAARLLGVTQSSVSHSLDRLRGLLGDPLFLKVGRSMVPTERVESMIDEIEHIISGIETLYRQAIFDPAKSSDRFSIVCNDYEHDLLVPAIFKRLKQEAPNCSLKTYQLNLGVADPLEKGFTDLELCPYAPADSSDLVVSKLCSDRMITYYDPSMRNAPGSLHDFVDSDHAILSWDVNESTAVDKALAKHGLSRRVSYLGPSFTSVAMVIKGTKMLATAPSRLAHSIFRDLAWVEAPLQLDPGEFHMVWHIRNRHSPRHKWFRELIKTVAKELPETSAACEHLRKGREQTQADTKHPESSQDAKGGPA
ncbi:LysR family transcriptional regulator [uncultured Cohaesibacter sp.]|uniref:LysR family transcriptional regulator n=1 Tax=uncultured Cohaesibacter sp. TaxID=1002546 RepID=UPI0029309551|nr:LysR family transcriptional regulator [uncultured Cohaesibacter sp.]